MMSYQRNETLNINPYLKITRIKPTLHKQKKTQTWHLGGYIHSNGH